MPNLTSTKVVYKPRLIVTENNTKKRSLEIASVVTKFRRVSMSTTSFVAGGFTYTVDNTYRYIGQQLSKAPILSFSVKKLSENNWYLTLNQNQFAGRYPSQAACLGVLYGMYTAKSGLDPSFSAYIANALENGSVIDPDVNLMRISNVAAGDPVTNTTTIELELFDEAAALAASGAPNADTGYGITYETSTDGVTWSTQASLQSFNVPGFPSGNDIVDGDSKTITSTTIWSAVPENGYVRSALLVFDNTATSHVASVSKELIKNDTDDTNLVFTVDISGESTAGYPVILDDFAYAIIDDSGSTLDPGESISYTYSWFREIPVLDSLTATTS